MSDAGSIASLKSVFYWNIKTYVMNLQSFILSISVSVFSFSLNAQGLSETSQSQHAVMHDVPLGNVRWTDDFWGERFNVFSRTSVQSMWQTWQNPDISHGFRNFEIAAGDCEGEHWGPPFHDGDMYKWLEGMAAVYAVTKDAALDTIMDTFIDRVVRSQRADGYIHTPVIIKERNKRPSPSQQGRGEDTSADEVGEGEGAWSGDSSPGVQGNSTPPSQEGAGGGSSAFSNRLNFETYNLGHLITAGIVHKRATGKTTLFDCGVRAADFLYDFCQRAPEELAGNAICPSHYMAVAELYRETGNAKYLDLLRKFIDIRGMVQNGTDDNQDRDPFETQYEAMGHAVRSTYLYAGVADVMAEIGHKNADGHDWMANLTSIWQDIVGRKMYITGGCGALYDGTSPDGTNYTPDSIQKVHQSYGRPYQLPHSTAHNETCANIGNMLFNWRMLEATADAKYADLVENCFYNSILPGISLKHLLEISRHPADEEIEEHREHRHGDNEDEAHAHIDDEAHEDTEEHTERRSHRNPQQLLEGILKIGHIS